MPGKNTELSRCATTLARRFSPFSTSKVRWNSCSRLYAWTTAMPAIDSAMCAVTAAMRFRTSVKATCDRTWNQRVRSSAGGTITQAASAEPPVEDVQPDDRRDQRQAVRDERREALAEDVGERVDVARQARDDPARALLREVAERQAR